MLKHDKIVSALKYFKKNCQHTLCGASCSETNHWRSDAFGKCFSENFLRRDKATDSAVKFTESESWNLHAKKVKRLINLTESNHKCVLFYVNFSKILNDLLQKKKYHNIFFSKKNLFISFILFTLNVLINL